MNVIYLPSDTVKVNTNDIPLLIASAIIPESQASNEHIVAIEKFDNALSLNKIDKTGHSLGCLSDSELTQLSKVCRLAGLDCLYTVVGRKDTNISAWAKYDIAIKNHSPKLNYNLRPVGKTLLQITTEGHKEYLEISVENGDIVAHDCTTHIPVKNARYLTTLERAYLTIDVFKQYVTKFNLKVVFTDNTLPSNSNEVYSPYKNSTPPCVGTVNAINQLALEIAWKLEQENIGDYKVTAKLVILELQKIASAKSNPLLLGLTAHGVKWFTSSSGESRYDITACRQTLSRWHKRRQIASAMDNSKS